MEYTFTLNDEETLLLGKVLEEQPFKIVGQLVRKLEAQAVELHKRHEEENEKATRKRVLESLTDEERAELTKAKEATNDGEADAN
jgi:hypothetical protein